MNKLLVGWGGRLTNLEASQKREYSVCRIVILSRKLHSRSSQSKQNFLESYARDSKFQGVWLHTYHGFDIDNISSLGRFVLELTVFLYSVPLCNLKGLCYHWETNVLHGDRMKSPQEFINNTKVVNHSFICPENLNIRRLFELWIYLLKRLV